MEQSLALIQWRWWRTLFLFLIPIVIIFILSIIIIVAGVTVYFPNEIVQICLGVFLLLPYILALMIVYYDALEKSGPLDFLKAF